MVENTVVIRDPKMFQSNFDWLNNVDEILKHQNEFITKAMNL